MRTTQSPLWIPTWSPNQIGTDGKQTRRAYLATGDLMIMRLKVFREREHERDS
jgi:hypothetical protein